MPISSGVAGWSNDFNSSQHRERQKLAGYCLKSPHSKDDIKRCKSTEYLIPQHHPDYVSPYSLPLPRIPHPEPEKKKRKRRKRKAFVAEDDSKEELDSSPPDDQKTPRKTERTPRHKYHKRSATAPSKQDEGGGLDETTNSKPRMNKEQEERNNQEQKAVPVICEKKEQNRKGSDNQEKGSNNTNNDKQQQQPFCNQVHLSEMEQGNEEEDAENDTELGEDEQKPMEDNKENNGTEEDAKTGTGESMDKQNQGHIQKEPARNETCPNEVAKNWEKSEAEENNRSGGGNKKKQADGSGTNQPTHSQHEASNKSNSKNCDKSLSDQGVNNNGREKGTNPEEEIRTDDSEINKDIKEEKQNGIGQSVSDSQQNTNSSNFMKKQNGKTGKKQPKIGNWNKVKNAVKDTNKKKSSKDTQAKNSNNPYKVRTLKPKHGIGVYLEESLTKGDSDEPTDGANQNKHDGDEQIKETDESAEPLKAQEKNHSAIDIKDDSEKEKVIVPIVSVQYL